VIAGSLDPLVSLAVELRPGLPYPVAQSLVIEALDQCADLLLCQSWAESRQRLAPEAARCAHSRHTASYAERRAVEWAAVGGS
jgi:hypothetical protein